MQLLWSVLLVMENSFSTSMNFYFISETLSCSLYPTLSLRLKFGCQKFWEVIGMWLQAPIISTFGWGWNRNLTLNYLSKPKKIPKLSRNLIPNFSTTPIVSDFCSIHKKEWSRSFVRAQQNKNGWIYLLFMFYLAYSLDLGCLEILHKYNVLADGIENSRSCRNRQHLSLVFWST